MSLKSNVITACVLVSCQNVTVIILQYFNTVGWMTGRASSLYKVLPQQLSKKFLATSLTWVTLENGSVKQECVKHI